MICYRLRCPADHGFEGWFPSSESFARQVAAGLISCPECGDVRVGQALMAPAVHTGGQKRKIQTAPEQVGTPEVPAGEAPVRTAVQVPDQVLAVLQRMRQYVETTCENMGEGFADEALKIHRGEADERGIYGTMTGAEREMLDEEGVETALLPWVSRSDS
ncbi:DUF1178 family protein [Acetobacter sp. AN02]|uniref:DUF1178 family protein n=1 Tax=Acetobacter sp. AN02 TaxID=2894186 RepID=UPI002434536E|nr:DUF1178 family protein [Acetobacter sp. AN02]MDG6094970.1 DUF1178 family protein [Acetobacter sp. AN02]